MRRTDSMLRIVGAHSAAAVEQYGYILIAFVLKLTDDRPVMLLCGLPVDVTDRIPGPLVDQLIEVRAGSAPLHRLQPRRLDAAGAGRPGNPALVFQIGGT